MSVINAHLHALVEDFRESGDVAEATLGLILKRQTDKLDGHELGHRLHEVISDLQGALHRFESEWWTVINND